MLEFLNGGMLLGGATFALIGIPVLIHLINMLRHRRVEWAAMEFLLASQKKNRTYILLKQLLLLLLRMAAVAALIMILARPLLRESNWAKFLAGSVDHHVIVLDDSFSMSDRGEDNQMAFDRAKEVALKIAQRGAAERSRQEFTLIRTSKGTPEIQKMRADSAFEQSLSLRMKDFTPSQLSTGPEEVLTHLDEILGPAKDENRLVYVLTDFREGEWNEPTNLSKAMRTLNESGTQVILVNCVDRVHENLAVVDLSPVTRSRAVGVPAYLDVSVKNYGTKPARNIALTVKADDVPRPGVLFDQIPPGKTETKRIPAQFLTAGDHQISVSLPADAIEADNARHTVLDFPLEISVLIIDGNPTLNDSFFLASALNPGGKPGTAINPRIEPPQFLGRAPLDKYRAIYLLNVARLDQTSIKALEDYVKQGGGLAYFVGDNVDPAFFNRELYRGGEGSFPVELMGRTELLIDRVEKVADLKITDHPILAIFGGERNSFVSLVNITYYMAVKPKWTPPEDSTVKVVARLRNDVPLIIEQQFGKGRVMTFLTSAGSAWNNWPVDNPSYPVVVQELQSYLAGIDSETRTVGTGIEMKLDAAQFKNHISLLKPTTGGGTTEITSEAQQTPEGLLVKFPRNEVGQSGVYTVKLLKTDDAMVNQSYAYNVDVGEGDLQRVKPEQLVSRLEGVDYTLRNADEFQGESAQRAGVNLSEWLLYLLLIVMIVEQFLAYLLSFHPPQTAKGGAR